MQRPFTTLMFCLWMTAPVFADDGAGTAPQPVNAEAPQFPSTAPTDKKKDLLIPPVLPSSNGQSPSNSQPATRAPGVEDPFGAQPRPASGAKDPFGADPFGPRPAAGVSAEDPFGVPATRATPSSDPFAQRAPRKGAASKKAASQNSKKKVAEATGRTAPSFALATSSESVQNIERQLGHATTFDYLDTPLRDVVDEIAVRHGIPVVLDVRGLEDFGIGTDTPVTIHVGGVSLRSALRLMLKPLELTYVIKNEVLQITTPEVADQKLRSRFYAVACLLPANHDGSYLAQLITNHVDPDSWDEVGGAGVITYVEHLQALVVTQTEEVHEQIEALLAAVAEMAKQVPARE